MTSQISRSLDQGKNYTQILRELKSGVSSDYFGDLKTIEGDLREAELIFNDKKQRKNFFKVLKQEMLTSEQVDFMVSFIRMSGVQLLIPVFLELERLNKKVRVLSSTYLNITEAKALEVLQRFKNIEVKIFQSGNVSFHTKAYLFHRELKPSVIIVGSSNLSQSALQYGYEWNVKIPDALNLSVFRQGKEKFEEMWRDPRAVLVTELLIERYKQHILKHGQGRETTLFPSKEVKFILEDQRLPFSVPAVAPNQMQQEALQRLTDTRKQGNKKAIIIAATGTGKTYLAALDVWKYKPKRLLFIAHRDELLDNAIQTFHHVFGKDDFCGKLTGSKKEFNQPFVFSTVQTLHKENNLKRFSPTEFDYIVIDEFHHAEAPTYQKVLNYFQPKFLLGLTATPERMDGKDILALCDYNVVYEVRLRDALEKNLLCPFHYFGVVDQTVNYDDIPTRRGGFLDETILVKALNTEERVEYILKQIDTYGYDGPRMIGLGFCANIKHAKFMSDEFNKRGYSATYLTGEHSAEERKRMIKNLEDENHPLQIIFTVNIFNEGIDIPKVNLILFLRPTESSTVFIQQLGRGLRKAEGKEFVTILDFIGNYQKSFVMPLALAGQTNKQMIDRNALRNSVETEFADLPGGCYVEFDRISQKQILDKIDRLRFDRINILRNFYYQFRQDLGRSPELRDFLYAEKTPDPYLYLNKFGSWIRTKEKMDDLTIFDQKLLQDPYIMEIIDRMEAMLPIKYPYGLILLQEALTKERITIDEVIHATKKRFSINDRVVRHDKLIMQTMQKLASVWKKQQWSFGKVEKDTFFVDFRFTQLVQQDPQIAQYLQERIDFGLVEYARSYEPEKLLTQDQRLILHQTYTRDDIIFLFETGAKEGSWREGVRRVQNHYFLFVNLNKDEDVEEHLNYHDYFINQSYFHWQSQNQTSHDSSVGQNFIFHQERNYYIHLFVRKYIKMNGITQPFTYLGEVDYVSSKGDKPMNIIWKLKHPLPEHLYFDWVRQ